MTGRAGDLAQRLASLSDARKDLLLRWLQDAGNIAARGRLTACVRAPTDIDIQQLRDDLHDRVPEYMVPQRIVTLDDLPRTPAGKIDRRALAAASAPPAVAPSEHDDAPRSATEQTLVAIWAEVLGFEDLDVHDDFFEVGGDSLLSIRILSRASKAGLSISPEDFFAHPTIAGQAAIVQPTPARRRAPAAKSGPLPLLPIQRWFFDAIYTHPEHWNQSLLFTVHAPVSTEQLTRALNALIGHHDALRSAFARDEDGNWQARIEAPGSYDVVRAVDVAGLDAAARDGQIAAHADAANAQLDLNAAPLLRAVHFTAGAGEPDRFLLVAHHLIVDAQSWSTLIDDLQTLCRQLVDGAPMRLGEPATTVREWSERLAGYVQSDALDADLHWWRDALRGPFAQPLPLRGEAASDTEAQRAELRVALEPDETATLLGPAGDALRVSTQEALLGALGLALARRASGSGTLAISLEGHGREALFEDTDLARSVGWFTTVFPVALPPADADAWRDPRNVAAAAKQALRALPLNGLSHGIVCTREGADADAVRAAPGPDVLFNYLGRVEAAQDDALLRLVDARCGRARHGECPRAFALEINATVEDGCLRAEFAYGPARLDGAIVEALAADFIATLRELIGAAHAQKGAPVTPADFPLAGLDQQELDDLSDLLDDMDS